MTSSVESVPWSAEEFEGELVDRVRRSVVVEERPAGPPPATTREVPPAESQTAELEDSHPANAADESAAVEANQPGRLALIGRRIAKKAGGLKTGWFSRGEPERSNAPRIP